MNKFHSVVSFMTVPNNTSAANHERKSIQPRINQSLQQAVMSSPWAQRALTVPWHVCCGTWPAGADGLSQCLPPGSDWHHSARPGRAAPLPNWRPGAVTSKVAAPRHAEEESRSGVKAAVPPLWPVGIPASRLGHAGPPQWGR